MKFSLLLTLLAVLILSLPTHASRHHAKSSAGSPAPANSGSIQGVVRAGLKNLPHITVYLLHKHHSVHSNSSGEFTFHNLRPGMYTLIAHTRHHGNARAALIVSPNQTSTLVLALCHPRHYLLRYHHTVGI